MQGRVTSNCDLRVESAVCRRFAEFFNRQGNEPVANPVTLVNLSRRLSERDVISGEARCGTAGHREANSARQNCVNGPAMFKRRAIRAADDREQGRD